MRNTICVFLLAVVLAACFLQFVVVSSHNTIQEETNEKRAPYLTILMPTIARGDSKSFEYLNRTLERLENVKTHSFQPLIRVFHLRGLDSEASIHFSQVLQHFPNVHAHIVQKLSITSNRFSEAQLKPNEAQQTDDVFDMLTLASEMCLKNELFMFMEDDFEICFGAEYQILHALEEASRMNGQFSAIRVSTGLNGIIFPCSDISSILGYMIDNTKTKLPVDWLLENWWAMNNLEDSYFGFYANANLTHAHNRQFFVYKYQLFHHLGTKSTMGHTWIAPHSACNERLIYTEIGKNYDLLHCAHSLFSPCSQQVPIDYPDHSVDVFHLPTFNSVHTLQQVQDVTPLECNTSCAKCCTQIAKRCNPEFLPYVNRCDNYKTRWKCSLESISCATAPSVVANTLFLLSRASRFFCDSYPQHGEIRICPCTG